MCYTYTSSNTSTSSSTLSSTKITNYVTATNNVINTITESNIIDSFTMTYSLITDSTSNTHNISNDLDALSKILKFKYFNFYLFLRNYVIEINMVLAYEFIKIPYLITKIVQK
jgi:hypothetical protein